MKDKIVIVILVIILLINGNLIITNQRLEKEIKFAKIFDNNNDEDVNNEIEDLNMKKLLIISNSIDKLKIKEIESVEINKDFFLININAQNIQEIETIEKEFTKSLNINKPEIDLFFNKEGVKGILKYEGERK